MSAYVPPERSWTEVVAHLILRLVLVLVGYLVAVLVTLLACVVLYTVLSSLPGAPDYFSAFSMAPLVALMIPTVGTLIFLVALILSFIPALLMAVLTEIFKLRSVVVHGLIGAAVASGSFAISAPTIIEGSEALTGVYDILLMAGAGVFGGIAYWLIAGRKAGFKADRETWPLPAATPQNPG